MIRNSLERRKVFLGRLASLPVIAFVAALVLLSAACNNVNLAGKGSGSGTVSLAIGDVLTKSVRSAGEPLRQTLAAGTEYTVKARLSGGHTAETSITVDSGKLAGAALSFEGIPIGVTVRLDLEVWAGNSLVWIGSTVDDHTVVSGENPLSVEVGRVSGVLLWDSTSVNIAPYGNYESKTSLLTNGSPDPVWCFDNLGNLYWYTAGENAVIRSKLQADGTYSALDGNYTGGSDFLAYDNITDSLYKMLGTEIIKAEESTGSHLPEEAISPEEVSSPVAFAVHDNIAYIVDVVGENEDGILQIIIRNYNLGTSSRLTESSMYQLPPSFGTNPSYQMIYHEGALYLLLSRVSIYTMYDTSVPTESYSLGAVLKINPDTLALDTSFGYQGYLGLADTSQTISGINATDAVTDGTVVYHGPTSSNDASVFYGPQGFVAIMPKKLVIADAGFSVSEDGNKIALTKKSRIITVDLETLAFETERVEDSYYQSEYPSSSTSGYEYIK